MKASKGVTATHTVQVARLQGRCAARLTEEETIRCLAEVRSFLKRQQTIRNRELREVAGIGYDQAIAFFNWALAKGFLVRKGTASSTHYVLP